MLFMKQSEKISIVLPVYNEADKIESIVKSFYNEIVRKLPNPEFIVAEDGSTDGTKEILKRLKKTIPMRLVMKPERKGYLRGVRDALLLAKGDIVFFSDSDGQYDPKDFWNLYEKIKDYDLVVGVRTKRTDPFVRKLLTTFYNSLVWVYFGFYLSDTNSGFKMMRNEVVKKIVKNIKHIKYGFSTELIVRAFYDGLKISAVPITHLSRETGVATQFTLKRIPKVIREQIRGIRALKSELKGKRFYKNKIDVVSE